ncbi:LCP family protein [Actinoplanes sp. NEAU-A12]|uniref:LCP family protein n=1 Tax=Actinoplanes sandaracinus TaxID=3045177 RepID=A0ABT6WN70_9ACTN|nr:LCP family protein [Actinoplanes sandaracinus]MDI6101157.1 LCP family protein [Actinoplanes sandaracinus]
MESGLDSGGTPMAESADKEKTRRSGRFRAMPGWKKALLVLSVLMLVTAGGVTGGGYLLYSRYEGKIERAALLPEAPAEEIAQTERNWESGPLNLLLLGSDSRATESGGTSPIGERSDTIMLVHIAKTRDKAAIVSIPRDSYVDVPASGAWKGGKNKINAAFAFGGATLTAKTVRQLTGVPLDGAMIANFASIRDLVGAVGGVNVCVPYDVRSTHTTRVWAKGCHDLDSDTAEDFMRQRYDVPGGDFGRMYNQQLVVKGIIAKVSTNGTLTNPLELDSLISIGADSLTVDQSVDLRDLAFAVKDIKPAAISYATVPYTSASLKTSAGSAVKLDAKKSAEMFTALKDDTIDQWLAANPQKTPGS